MRSGLAVRTRATQVGHSVVLTQPDEFVLHAADYSAGFVNGAGNGTNVGTAKIYNTRSGGSSGDALKFEASPFDSTLVIGSDATTGAISNYLSVVAQASTAGAASPFFANAVVYQKYRYRTLNYSTFTGTSNVALGMCWNDINSFATTDTGNHCHFDLSSIIAATYSNGVESSAIATFSGLADPGNGWRNLEYFINRTTGVCVIRDWNDDEHNYSTSLLIDAASKYPTFQFYQANAATGRKIELEGMWGSTLEAMDAPRLAYFNKGFADAGLTPPAPPAAITVGSPVVDDFNRTDTPTGDNTALGSSYSVLAGNQPMRIFGNAAQAGAYGVLGVADYRNDYLFSTVNQRTTYVLGSAAAPAWPMMPHVRASATGQAMWAYLSNTVNSVFYTSTTAFAQPSPGSTQRGTGGPSPDTTTMAAGTVWSLEGIGEAPNDSFYIIRKDGVYWWHWQDADSATYTGTGKIPVVSSYSNGAGSGQINSCTWEDLGTNAFLSTKMTGTAQTFGSTSGTWVAITTWTSVNSATANVPDWTTIASGNGFACIGTHTNVTIAASIPFTGNTGGRANKIRIKKNGTQIGSDSATVSTSSGTCTLTLTGQSIASGDVITVEMASTGAGTAGTVTATTSFVTAVAV